MSHSLGSGRGNPNLLEKRHNDSEETEGHHQSKPLPGNTPVVADQLARWKLTKGQASGLNNAHRNTERLLASIQPHLKQLAAASSAGTSLEANLEVTVTLGTWGAVWEVNLDPKWARQRLRLFKAQDRAKKMRVGRQVSGKGLNMQRNGESRWRPLELCRWPDLPEVPAKGKEYPELGYKPLRE
ncbi:hypothetical protein QJQ45_028523 [Haematococcus lacustris]|nr:hypothetical protein QJQ45_028523 [Haematococcus lacustris]